MVKITPVLFAAQEVNKVVIYQGNKAQVWAAISFLLWMFSAIENCG